MNAGHILLALLAAATVFLLSGMEAGLPALNRLRVRHRAREGDRRARLLQEFLAAPERFLWTILVGNTLAWVALLALVFHPWYVALGGRRALLAGAMIGTVGLLYMLADLLPKMLFRQFPTRLCLALARPFAWVHTALGPVVWAVEALARGLLEWTGGEPYTGRLFRNREELRQLLLESAQSLTSEEQRMVTRVLDMQRLSVGTLMRPLSEVVGVTTTASVGEVLRLARESGHDRLPVWTADGRPAGVVSLSAVLYREDADPGRPVLAVMRPAVVLPESAVLEAALLTFRRTGERLAVVVNARQRPVGILSLSDVLRFIFGEVMW